MEHGRLILQRAAAPIEEPVTKFGALPVWVEERLGRYQRQSATWDPHSGENAAVIQELSSGGQPSIVDGPRA